jgi:hypothetical protein
MMKKILFTYFLLVFISFQGFGQILDPVHWSFTSKHISGNTFELTFTAKIDKGWHIFSQTLPATATPLPTTFTFDSSKAFTAVGGVKEISTSTTMKDIDKTTDLKMYEGEAVFVQQVKITGKTATVKGTINYMKCNEKMCLPPEDVPFSFGLDVKDGSSAVPANQNSVPNTPSGNNSSGSNLVITQSSSDLHGKGLWQVFLV